VNGAGSLSGWAWNDAVGWISFCGGGDTNPDCPGTASAYGVTIDSSGYFHGWAWNDVVGWISFNCADPGLCALSDYKVRTSWVPTSSVSTLDSAVFDTGVQGGAQVNSVIVHGDRPVNTQVQFQIAAGNVATGPWNFTGPDGTSLTYYQAQTFITAAPNTLVVPNIDRTLHNNQRYVRYRVYLVSNPTQTAGPRIDDIIISWSP
jgi:hypothetical protein